MRYYGIVLSMLIAVGCGKLNADKERVPIARVNKTFLYKDEISDLIPKGASKDDSTNIASLYIKNWATKQLLIDQAQVNLKESELKNFDKLVEDYRNTLYINAYKEAVVTKSIDLGVSEENLITFYEENLENFNLNEDVVSLRYLHLPSQYGEGDLYATQIKLDRFKEKDKEYLSNKKMEFVKTYLQDSVWISYDELISKLPILTKRTKDDVLKEGKFMRQRDTAGIYLVKINKVLRRGDVAPLSYIKPTLRQIILNQRKKELIKNLEKDITKDAITNKQFEVFK